MGLIDKVRQMLGAKDLPDELTPLYRGAKSEREALALLKESMRRDESRRRRAMQDIEVLDQMEEELLEEGKNETGENRKLLLARRIKEIRQKIADLNDRIETIYNRRIKVFNEHIRSLEKILELEAEPLPDRKTIEDLAIKAADKLDELVKASELAEGIATNQERPQPDEEEQEILREMERRADIEIEKEGLEEPAKEKETAKKEPKEKETAKVEKAEAEEPGKEKAKTERKTKETKEKEKKEKGKEPEILFEE